MRNFDESSLESNVYSDSMLGEDRTADADDRVGFLRRSSGIALLALGVLSCDDSRYRHPEEKIVQPQRETAWVGENQKVDTQLELKSELEQVVQEKTSEKSVENLDETPEQVRERVLKEMITESVRDIEDWRKKKEGYLAVFPWKVFETVGKLQTDEIGLRRSVEVALQDLLGFVAYARFKEDLLDHFPDVEVEVERGIETNPEGRLNGLFLESMPQWYKADYARGIVINFASTHPYVTLENLPRMTQFFGKKTAMILAGVASNKCPRDALQMEDKFLQALGEDNGKAFLAVAREKAKTYPGRCQR